MSRGGLGSKLALVVCLLLTALYAWRAGTGWYGGLAYVRGKHATEHGEFKKAIEELDKGVVGDRKATALWLRAQSNLGYWQELAQREKAGRDVPLDEGQKVDDYLVRAHQDYLHALSLSPASGWYWVELSELYHLFDGLQRMEQGNLLSFIGRGPWARVGHQGRVAIGMARLGIAREPTVFSFHDRLTTMLLNYGMEDLAAEAVRESAKVQPLFYLHDLARPQDLSPPVLDAFAEGARESLGNAPMMQLGLHYIALGRVEIHRGNYTQAIEDLEKALELPGHTLNRADTLYHLGLAHKGLEQYDRAWKYLEESQIHENTTAGALNAMSEIAVAQGRRDEGLEILRRLRRMYPGRIEYALEFAGLARRLGRRDEAIEALQQVTTLAQDDERGYRGLILLYAEQGDERAARRELESLEQRTGRSFPRLEQILTAAVAAASDPTARSLSEF